MGSTLEAFRDTLQSPRTDAAFPSVCIYVGDVFDVLGHKAELGEVRSNLHEYSLCQLDTVWAPGQQ